MALVILGNSFVIGLETDFPDLSCWGYVEPLFVIVFLGELVLKLSILGPKGYFDRTNSDFTWNLFDFFIVSLGTVDALVSAIPTKHTDSPQENEGGVATIFRMI